MIESEINNVPDAENVVKTQRQVMIVERYVPPRSGGKVNILSAEEAEELRACASGRFPMWQSEEGDNDDEGDIVEDSYDTEDDSDEEGNVHEEDEMPKSPNNRILINNELLLSFESHVAHDLWDGFDRGVLSCHSQVHRVHKWSISSLSVIAILEKTGLFHLKDCMYKHLDAPLISAFVERWQPETNSFHLPFGEMTVTLHDVWYILRVPVMGKPLIKYDLSEEHVKALKGKLALLLGVDMSEVKKQWHKGTVHFDFIHKNLRAPNNSHDFVAWGYLLWLLGSTLFVDKTGNKCNCHFLLYLDNLEDVNNHAWGAATLAYLYRQLGVATRADTRQICSCLTLLQAWIYEYFPMFQPARRGDWTNDMPYACRWKPGSTSKKVETLEYYRGLLDRMTPNMVCWMPFIKFPHVDVRISLFNGIIHCHTITEPYMSNRVMRQFGYIQVIPPNPIQPQNVCRESRTLKYRCKHEVGRANWVTWMYHCMSLKDLTSKARFAGEVSDDYMDWFLPRTHPRVSCPRDEDDEMQPEIPSDPCLMTSQARFQFLAEHLYPLHPRMRHQIDAETFYHHLDAVCYNLEDYMPFAGKGPRGLSR